MGVEGRQPVHSLSILVSSVIKWINSSWIKCPIDGVVLRFCFCGPQLSAMKSPPLEMRNIILILLLLGVSYATARTLGGSDELAGRISTAALFCFTALGHFAKPNKMLEMLPPWVPSRKAVVLLSGFLEPAFAIGILIPAISHLTAIAAIVFLFLAAPLNIYSAVRRVNFGGHGAGPAYLLVRLPLQLFLIAWIWWFALRTSRLRMLCNVSDHERCRRRPIPA